MRVEYVEKTKTLIGTKRKELIDKETGEIIEVDQITKDVVEIPEDDEKDKDTLQVDETKTQERPAYVVNAQASLE